MYRYSTSFIVAAQELGKIASFQSKDLKLESQYPGIESV